MDWSTEKDDIVNTCVDTFGRDATYTPSSGDPIEIKAVFRREWIELKFGSSAGVSGYYTVADVRLADLLPAVPGNGDKLTIEEVEYKVIDCREDGGGGARLVLKK